MKPARILLGTLLLLITAIPIFRIDTVEVKGRSLLGLVGPKAASGPTVLPAYFNRCKLFIHLIWCPGYFGFPGRLDHSCSRHTLPAYFVAVECPPPHSLKGGPAVHALAWGRVFSGFSTVAEEHQVPTRGRTVRLRFSGPRVAEGSVQQLSAPVALIDDVQAHATDIGEFGGGELHAATLESEVLKGIGSRKTVGFRPAAPLFQSLSTPLNLNRFQWVPRKRSGLPRSVSMYGSEVPARVEYLYGVSIVQESQILCAREDLDGSDPLVFPGTVFRGGSSPT